MGDYMKLQRTIKLKCYESLIFILIFLLTIVSNSIYEAVSLQKNLNSQHIDTGFIQLKDNYDGFKGRLSIIEFFNEPNSLDKMKKLYIDIANDNNLKYYEILKQPLTYIGEYKGNPICTQGKEFINKEVDGKLMTTVNSLQIGYKTSNYLNIKDKIEYGEYFSEDDYLLDENKEVPVVLGYSYLENYNIGDYIQCDYLFLNLKLKVIGFLKKDSKFSIEYEDFLDNKIIMPSLNIESDNFSDSKFAKILYSLKNTGYIPYDNDSEYNYITTTVDNIADKLDIDWSYRGRVENPFEKNPVNISVKASKIIKISSWILSLILLILIFVLEKKRCDLEDFSLNKRDRLIMKTKIFGGILLQIILLYIITCFILWVCFRSNVIYSVLKNIQIRVFPIMLLSFIIIVYINNLHIEKSVRE